VTNPPQGPGDQSPWGRPPQGPPHTPPTERIPRQAPQEPNTQYIPTQRPGPQGPTDHPTQASPQWYPQTGGPTGQTPPPPDDHDDDRGILGWLKDPLSLVLVLVIVVALAAAGLVGGELYARKRADDVVSSAIACIVKDQATASFGVMPPFLWQHMTGHYTNISIETAGNQVRDAKGMKVTLDIKDVRLEDSGNSGGTIGSMVGNVTWSAEGIKQTVQGLIPLFGGIVSDVTTNTNDGTITLEGALGSITAKPTSVNGGLALEVLQVSGLGFTLPRETVQPALDVFTGELTKNYPVAINLQDVQVTDSGVTSQFTVSESSIPGGGQDPCLSGL